MKRVFCFAVLALFFVSLPSCAKITQPKPQEKETPDNTDPQDPQDPQQEESDTTVISLENLDQTDVNTSGSNGNSGNEGKKKVSLLGDSITTYQGYTPYPSNYQYPKSSYADFTSVSQTWWHQLIYNKMTDAALEVNSSYTGTCVQETTSQGHPGYGFLHRYVELGNPDVIIVNGGTNDSWSFKLPVGSLDFNVATDNLDTYQFAQAYDVSTDFMHHLRHFFAAVRDVLVEHSHIVGAYGQIVRPPYSE